MSDLTKLKPKEVEKERIDNPLIQQSANKISPGISTIPSMQSQAQRHLHIIAAYEQTEVELRRRLEQCEAALRANLERHGQCLCSSCDAARAALEEK